MANILAALAVLLLALHAARADDATAAAASHMQIIGHSDLNGAGKGGEGLAMQAISQTAAGAVPRT